MRKGQECIKKINEKLKEESHSHWNEHLPIVELGNMGELGNRMLPHVTKPTRKTLKCTESFLIDVQGTCILKMERGQNET